MADVTNSIRLNDYMSSTLRTINTTMERTISLMQRLDRGLHTLDATSVDGDVYKRQPLSCNLRRCSSARWTTTKPAASCSNLS